MNLVICQLSKNINKTIIQNWLHNYTISKCNMIPILYTDMFNKDIDLYWPFEVVSKSLKNAVVLPVDKRPYFNSVNYCMFEIIHRLNCYQDIGDCFIVDFFSLFKSNITDTILPKCKWGLIKKNSFSKSYVETTEKEYFNEIEEMNFIERVEYCVQIIKDDYVTKYVNNYKKYLPKVEAVKTLYPEMILALTHKQCNGVFLCDDWAWPPDSMIRNKTYYIEQYSSDHHKALLDFALNNNIVFEIDGKIIRKESEFV